MKWLVCINNEGVQCKILAGKDTVKAAKEQKDLNRHCKVMFIFDTGHDPDGSRVDQMNFSAYKDKLTKELHKKYSAGMPEEFFGYNLRKRYITDYIEVVADLDAKDYNEFNKKYSGLKGAIKILYNTEKVMSGSKDSAKAVSKLIRKIEIELED